MKVVILAGGLGTRISEESVVKPKPLVEIGGKPIIWHIMKLYSKYGLNDFIICCGYKGYIIKEYFNNYLLHRSDVTFNFQNNDIKIHRNEAEPWNISLIDTGIDTMTGGRLKRIEDYLDDTFCLTYGDGVSNVNIGKLIEQHKSNDFDATLTAVKPPGRFGVLGYEGNKVTSFLEKPQGESGWINGGFFVLNKKIINFIKNDKTIWEKEPLINLSNERQLVSFKHRGFWHPMDTIRDKEYLESLWMKPNCPWRKK